MWLDDMSASWNLMRLMLLAVSFRSFVSSSVVRFVHRIQAIMNDLQHVSSRYYDSIKKMMLHFRGFGKRANIMFICQPHNVFVCLRLLAEHISSTCSIQIYFH